MTYYEAHGIEMPERRKAFLESGHYEESRDPDYVDELYIGTIDLREPRDIFMQEGSYGKIQLKKYGQCTIFLYGGNEGQIPHFHLYNNDKSFETCICLHVAKYFVHEQKHKKHGTDSLSSDQKVILQNYLSSKNDMNVTVWLRMMDFWKAANPSCVMSQSKDWMKTPMPDYTRMFDSIHELD